MRMLRRLIAGAIVLLIVVQMSPVPVYSDCDCCRRGSSGAKCTCCRPGTTDECPMCKRVQQAATRCSARCNHGDADWSPAAEVTAVLPEQVAEFLDAAFEAVTAVPDAAAFRSCQIPPSPPPWAPAVSVA